MIGQHGAGAPIIREETMTTRTNGASAGFGWMTRGISVGFRHFKLLIGATALLVLAALMPVLVQLPLQFFLLRSGTQASPGTFALIMAVPMLLGLLILPIYAGYLQVIDAAEQGRQPRARDIFNPYRQGEALRLIGYGLAVLVVYLACIVLIIAATGSGLASWYLQLLTAQSNHLPPPTTLPAGFGTALTLLVVFGIFMLGFYSIGLGQVTLRRRRVFAAMGDGFTGTLKNLLPLVVFVLSILLAWIAAIIVIALLALLLGLIGKFVGIWIVFVVIVPLYIALLLVLISGGFGVMYHLWSDVCGVGTLADAGPTLTA